MAEDERTVPPTMTATQEWGIDYGDEVRVMPNQWEAEKGAQRFNAYREDQPECHAVARLVIVGEWAPVSRQTETTEG